MTHTNSNVIKIKAQKPRNQGLHEALMSKKPGPHQKRNKQKVSRKELWEILENA